MPEPASETLGGSGGGPRGEMTIRTLAMPADTNPSGDIFGGWLLSQMDIAGAIAAQWRARGRVATVGIEAMEFHRPVWVGDVLCCYTNILKIGTTSISVRIEAWVQRSREAEEQIKVTEGSFTYVALGEDGHKRPFSQD